MQNGTLTRKTECQPKWSTSRPPESGPTTIDRLDTLDQMPIALPRSAGSVKVVVRIDSVDGKMNAAPNPISARPMIRSVGEFPNDE